MLVVTACALLSGFDWKAAPTDKVKSDLVEYARSVGERDFAARIEKSTSAAQWMREAMRHGAKLLKASEGKDFTDKKREAGLRIIDYPLHVDNYGSNTTEEEKNAFKEVVSEYCIAARDRVFKEVASARVPKGSLRLWRIYNMGYIIKGPKHTVAIDVTDRPHFYKTVKGGGMMDDPKATIWRSEDWKKLVKMTDMFVLTHPHGDHFCRDGIEAYVAAGKHVVLPCDLKAPHFSGGPSFRRKGPSKATMKSYTSAPCCVKLTKDNLEPVDVGGVKVRNFVGNQGKDTPCNVYLLEIDGVRVAHNGDNYDMAKEGMLKKCPPADVIIASTWNNVQGMVGCCAAAPGFDRGKAVLLPSHENELGHAVDHRESYKESYTRQDRLGKKDFPWPRVHPLGFGESITVSTGR